MKMSKTSCRKNITYVLLSVMTLFTFNSAFAESFGATRSAFAHTTTNQNQQPITTNCQVATNNSQPTSIQWYISNGKDVVGTTDDAAEGEQTDSYYYTPYGRGTTLSSLAGGRWPVTGKGGQQNEILRNNNFSSKIKHQKFNINTNPFQYSGYYLDALSGLYYLNARYYSPEFMRFISRDSYDLSNRYAYCNGEPLSQADPTGHMPHWLGSIPGSRYVGIGLAVLGTLGAVGAFAVAGEAAELAEAGFQTENAVIVSRIGSSLGCASGISQGCSYAESGRKSEILKDISIGTAIAAAPFDIASLVTRPGSDIRAYRPLIQSARENSGEFDLAALDEISTKHEEIIANPSFLYNSDAQECIEKDFDRACFANRECASTKFTMGDLSNDQRMMVNQQTRTVQGYITTSIAVNGKSAEIDGLEMGTSYFSDDLTSNTSTIDGRIQVVTRVQNLRPSYSVSYIGTSKINMRNRLAMSVVLKARSMIATL